MFIIDDMTFNIGTIFIPLGNSQSASDSRANTHTHQQTHRHTHTHTNSHTLTPIHVDQPPTHPHTYTHTHIHTHTHTHTNIHTQTKYTMNGLLEVFRPHVYEVGKYTIFRLHVRLQLTGLMLQVTQVMSCHLCVSFVTTCRATRLYNDIT